MDGKGVESKNDLEEEVGIQVEENVNSNHRPFLSRLYSKTTPISFEYHQVYVDPWKGSSISIAQRQQQLSKRDISMRPQPTFLASRVKPDELEDYLSFVQSFYQQKISDYFTTGTVSKERTRAQAMDFLHKMNYNYVKAKFYILFPYYLTYNAYRCHDPLNITLEDMEKKIKDHLQGLRNTKEKDMEKWIDTLQTYLANRTNFQKFMTLIEQGKQNKYQIPQHIKQHIQKSQKIGKQLRKSLQGNRLPIEVLRAKREMLRDYKLITPEMVAFEDTVSRCQEWIVKLLNFEEKYLIIEKNDLRLKNPNEKIQFRQLQLLVSEYQSLPLLNQQFELTTKALYKQTTALLEAMPNISKIVKTRTSKQVTFNKIPYRQMQEYLRDIEKHLVWTEDFANFQINMRQSMELIERMSMYLEDPLSEKNSKTLNNYIKLMSDVQIENNVQKRLRTRQECNEIMDKIKKQISNPGKVQSIKQAFNKLREKGIKEVQDLVYQEKILMYIGWHESQEKLKESKPVLTNMDLIEKQIYLRQNLVNTADYKSQLESAKKEWNISEESIQQAYAKLQKNQQYLNQIKKLLADENPNLQIMLDVLRDCIQEGFMFPELWQLHDQIVRCFVTLAKIHTLLKARPQNLDEQVQQKFIFNAAQSQHILSIAIYPEQLKYLKTKQTAERILNQIHDTPFPKYLEQCIAFEDFMKKGEQWSQRVREMIKSFTEEGENIDIKELQDSRFYIHSKAIKQQIGKIQSIMRWRQKISKKLEDGKPPLFSVEEEQFLIQLEKDLSYFESNYQGTVSLKEQYLEYTKKYDQNIKRILYLIANESKVENICKLSQMNKFHREIEKENERHKIDDKKILELKEKFREEICLADQWKDKYLTIKRFEKKKILKKEDQTQNANDDVNGIEEEIKMRDVKQQKESKQKIFDYLNGENNNEMSPEPQPIMQQNRKKYTVKNGQFTWYFKFLIMILQFSKGYKLKFCLDELSKLKNTLIEIEKFLSHYDKIMEKTEPLDVQLTNLDSQASKINIFIRQIWLLKKKIAYVQSWKIIADCIIDSVPIVNMELKARKPQELLTVLAHRKQETQQASKQVIEERNIEQNPNKRERKPNSYYFTADITLYPEQNMNSKPKKKKKGGNTDGEYRNTSVSSQAKKNSKNQLEEIQRTQAIIKAGVEAGTLAQDPKQYCICRYGEPNENTTMVQCQQKCEEWYHIQCIGVKKHQARGQSSYTCVGCAQLYGMKSQGAFYWDYHSKISEYALQQIVTEGKNLGVFTQQFKKINIVYQKMLGWKKMANELIYNVLKDDFLGKQIYSYKQKLYECFLLSLWLPTYHHETSTIKRLLLICRDEKQNGISN